MKKIFLLLKPLPFLLLLLLPDKDNDEQTARQQDAPSFAVVELFTSEGCSSCPPADELLGNIIQEARKSHQRVYGLAFHVDYWNRLGWKDPFSSSEYSDRQRLYASHLDGRIYTPEMIVNGSEAFTGSNSTKAGSAIKSALNAPATASITIEEITTAKGKVVVRLNSDAPDKSLLQLALVERGLSSNVTRGENQGRKLHHQNVVRNLVTLKLPATTAEIEIPEDTDLSNASIIAFIQNPSTMKVIAADGKDI